MTRILIADDHQILRQGLRSLLERQADVRIVGEASDGIEVVAMAAALGPDIVILDITMPGLNGLEAAKQIIERDPLVKIIALSMHSDKRFVINMLSVGAYGYLLKNCAFEELAIAVRTVLAGKIYVSPSIAGPVLEEYLAHLKSGRLTSKALTRHEVEVIRLIANGRSVKEIAFATGISPKTVSLHRQQIMEKLEIDSTAELVKFAIREGIISLEE